MLCRLRSCRFVVAAGLALCCASKLLAAPASEQLLPSTTKGYVSVGSIDRLRADWDKTQIGQLMADPIMQPFVEDFRAQVQKKWNQSHQKLGLTWEDLEGVPGGEVALAIIEPAKNAVAQVLIVDVTGHLQQTNALLEKVATNMAARKAKRTVVDLAGIKVTSYDIPKQEDHPARHAFFGVKDDVLVASDNAKVLEGIFLRFSGKAQDSLAALPAFEYVQQRCKTQAGDVVPHLRWFVEPFGYVDAMRTANPQRSPRKGTDMLKVLRRQGFTAVQGVGGFATLLVEKFEFVHQTAIYAPPTKPGDDRYELAANMLDFPNGGNFEPQAWVPREIATYATFNLKPSKAFESSKTLVNDIVGDEVFEDVLKSIEEDPNGPQINIRKDLIAHLAGRGTVVSDYQLPITPKSERMLVAVETSNSQALTETIEKSMKSDPAARKHEYKGHVIWEIVNEEEGTVPMVTIENHPAFGPNKGEEEEEESRDRLLPNSAVTVAYGQLLWCTHYDFLTKVLSELPEREQLVSSNEYRLVKAELDRLSGGNACAQTFSRTDEEYRAVYELIRTGRMPEAETILAKLLNSILGEGKEGVPRAQRINGAHLPDYEAVRRYFGPAGMTAVSEDNGWFLTGFMLNKEAPPAAEAAPAAAE